MIMRGKEGDEGRNVRGTDGREWGREKSGEWREGERRRQREAAIEQGKVPKVFDTVCVSEDCK